MKSIFIYGFFLFASAWNGAQPGHAGASTGKINPAAAKKIFRCENGYVGFRSKAALEIIEAHSRQLRGVVDAEAQSFAWSVEIASFEGFNSPLQREHFNENYMERERFPKATFTGKIIEKLDFSQNGTFPVRAKGRLVVHGVEQERIIKGEVEIKGQTLRVQASFTVPLTDHNISIPKIVHQKIAEEIVVMIDCTLNTD